MTLLSLTCKQLPPWPEHRELSRGAGREARPGTARCLQPGELQPGSPSVAPMAGGPGAAPEPCGMVGQALRAEGMGRGGRTHILHLSSAALH